MKIPISLTYKYFSETITIKKRVDSLNIGDTLEMYKNIIVPIYGEVYYERAIISLADNIKERRKKIIKPKGTITKIVEKIFNIKD
jgi:hypothetical protein